MYLKSSVKADNRVHCTSINIDDQLGDFDYFHIKPITFVAFLLVRIQTNVLKSETKSTAQFNGA